MPEEERLTLVAVINKIKAIANDQYEGHIYDNVLAVFNQLTTKEKRLLLKGLINICFIVEDKVLHENSSLKDVKQTVLQTTELIEHEIGHIEHYNKVELIKLKSWLVKMLTVTLLSSFAVATLFLLFVNTGNESKVFDITDSVFKILKTIFGA